MLVRDIMTSDVVTVSPSTSLKEAARRMLAAGISGMPVMDGDELVGIVTEADFVADLVGERPRRRLLGLVVEETPVRGETVGEVMTTDLVTIGPDAPARAAARLMMTAGVKRLPVVDGDGHLVGIVSRADLLKTMARDDDTLAEELRARLARLPVATDRVTVEVVDGVATLTGTVETSADAKLVVATAEATEGVVSVHAALDVDVDLDRVGPRWSMLGDE